MINPVLVDTGPLVAAISARERNHPWVNEQLQQIKQPMLTCEAVITEACFLLGQKQELVFKLMDAGVLEIGFSLKHDVGSICKLMDKYADVPMSLADACLVRMSEIHDGSKVFTLDGDFKIYRRNGRQTIPLIFPGQG
ncbi:MAG: PIN domain-containing protein [Verrucomicrobia bacterium]|nr:PIN domain-containing protein [Verrucomicrobiota bacterium]